VLGGALFCEVLIDVLFWFGVVGYWYWYVGW